MNLVLEILQYSIPNDYLAVNLSLFYFLIQGESYREACNDG
jgi:hypothetical protein